MKKIVIEVVIILLIITWLVYFIPWVMDDKSFLSNIREERDIHNFQQYEKIKEYLNKNKLSFSGYVDFVKKSWESFYPSKNCYYLNSLDGWKWYIISFKLESSKNIKKFWKDYFIYKNVQDYNISNEEMNEIQKIINKPCSK